MKFLQIHTFYEPYLAEFAGRHPDLAKWSHEQIQRVLLEDGFSACHLLAPHLSPSRWNARLHVANFQPLQRAWARERGLESLTPAEILESQIEEFQPDIIYASDPVRFDSRFFRRLSWQPKLLVGWRAASVLPDTDWSTFDLILSNHAPSLEMALKRGAQATERFEPGLPSRIAQLVEQEPEDVDVVFCGQWTDEHQRRNAQLMAAAAASEEASRPFSIELHLLQAGASRLADVIERHKSPPLFGMEMHRLFKRGRICLNAMIDTAQGMSANMRLFEIAGTGGFQLMEHHEDIGRYFEPGTEIATYRGVEDLVEKIRHYLAHPQERREIARRGRERCEREFTMEKRIPWFEEILREHLARVSARTKTASPGAGVELRLRKKLIAAEAREAKLTRRLQDREADLAQLKKSLAWKLARPLFKLESFLRGLGSKKPEAPGDRIEGRKSVPSDRAPPS